MKKYISIMIAVVLIACNILACSSEKKVQSGSDDKLKIVTTIFPEYDWVNNVLGENVKNAEVTMLLDNGVDLHSYQPSAEDIMRVSDCDMFIYVGGESDEWVEDALAESTNKNMVVINLMDVLKDDIKEEEVVEGMEEEEEEGEEETEYDEHVWLSLKNAEKIVKNISEEIQKIDSANAENYKKNAESYIEKLDALDKEYGNAVDNASVKTLLFGDRFPFRYMTDDYGMTYYAAFVGCSAETEASFETITFLAKKTDELSLGAVMTIEGNNHEIAETIVENTKDKNQKILTLDSMQSVTSQDVKDGVTYLSIMENNLDVLKEALK